MSSGPGGPTATLDLDSPIDFVLPDELEASAPAEMRGLARNQVRMLVTRCAVCTVSHARFDAIDSFLEPGDVLVVNDSATLNASLPAERADGSPLRLHLSTRRPDGRWVVELRQPDGQSSQPFLAGRKGDTLLLPEGGRVRLDVPHERSSEAAPRRFGAGSVRLWVATLTLPTDVESFTARHGRPIRYGYAAGDWPIEAYQTVFASEPGSAEMPSAARPFTLNVVERLRRRGVIVATLTLHTGVASLEEDERPYAEPYRVPVETAEAVNAARAQGNRVLAVGTTAVRALETVSDESGRVRAGTGWTELVITPERGVRVVDGVLTGLHEPRASHLWMLEAIMGRDHLERAYEEALTHRYLWHEFGDVHLVLPPDGSSE